MCGLVGLFLKVLALMLKVMKNIKVKSNGQAMRVSQSPMTSRAVKVLFQYAPGREGGRWQS